MKVILDDTEIATAEVAVTDLDGGVPESILIDMIAKFLLDNKAVVFQTRGNMATASLKVILPPGVKNKNGQPVRK